MTLTDPQPLPSPSGRPGLILRTLRRHWIGILAASLLVDLAAGFLVFQNVRPTYRALSLIRVDPSSTDLYNIRGPSENLEAFLQTQVQLITSPNVLTAAGTNPKAAILPRINRAGDVVQELRGAVSVSVVPGTYLIEVSMTSDNGYEAATIVNAVVDAYMEANSEWSDGMTRVPDQEPRTVQRRPQEPDRRTRAEVEGLRQPRGDLDHPGRSSIPREGLASIARVIIPIEEFRPDHARQLNAVKLELAKAQAWLTTAKNAVKKIGRERRVARRAGR